MSADPLSAIVGALEKEHVIPDVLPRSMPFTPSVLFSVVYPNGAEVNLGNELTVADTLDEPEIRLAALNAPWADGPAAEASYTLAMLDPDAPYRADAIYRSFRHWVVSSRLCISRCYSDLDGGGRTPRDIGCRSPGSSRPRSRPTPQTR